MVIDKGASMKYFLIACLFAANIIAAETLSVAEFKKLNPLEGSYKVEGYLSVFIYDCYCPPGSLCKPCMPNNHVLISDQPIDEEEAKGYWDKMREDAKYIFVAVNLQGSADDHENRQALHKKLLNTVKTKKYTVSFEVIHEKIYYMKSVD
jgi:hypothetical protein